MNRILLFIICLSSLSVSAQFEKKMIKQIEKSAAFLPNDTLIIHSNDLQIGANKDSIFGNTCLGEKGWQAYYVNLEGGTTPKKIQSTLGFAYELPPYIQSKVGGIYINQVEVSNGQYSEFVEWTRTNNPDKLQEVLVDSQGWKFNNSSGGPMMTYYHMHPAYDNYPVVNISHEQAKVYLNWLTDQYNKSPKRKYKKVVFRLPTEAEWMYAYLGGQSLYHATYNQSFRRPNGRITANFITIQQGSIIKLQSGQKIQASDSSMKISFTHCSQSVTNGDTVEITRVSEPNILVMNAVNPWYSGNGFYTTPVKSYWPNKWGIYNMAGNVAEFVAMDGIAKGGHWGTTGYYLLPNSRETFIGQKSSSPTRGFRWVMEVIEE